jgi:hypothetical protein
MANVLVYSVYPCIIGKIAYQHEKYFGFELWVKKEKRDLCIRNERRRNFEIRALLMHTKHANVNDTSSVKNGSSFFSQKNRQRTEKL